MSNLVDFDNVGSVEVRSSIRAKRMKLGVKTDGTPFLTIPSLATISKADVYSFVNNNAEWIKLQQRKFKNRQTIFIPNNEFNTYSRKLNIVFSEREIKAKAALLTHEIRVVLPVGTKVESARIQKFIRMVIEASMREEAKLFLPKLTLKLASEHQLHFHRVSIKNTKTRWGSCSSKKNINLNLHLMRLPERLINYVILHELAHTVELNHGVKFWKLLEKICPEAKKLDKELNHYNTEIY